jgi:hypothetical protein
VIFFQTSFVATAQSISEGLRNEAGQSATAWQTDKYKSLSFPSLVTPLKSQPLEAPYEAQTREEHATKGLSWNWMHFTRTSGSLQ